MSAYAYVHMPGYGLMPVRQCRHCGELFVVLEREGKFTDYCPGKDCGAEARRVRRRAQYPADKVRRLSEVAA